MSGITNPVRRLGRAPSAMGKWGHEGHDGGLGIAHPPNGAQRFDDVEAIRSLASVDYGRVVFTLDALPAICPANHLMDGGQLVIRTRLTSVISSALRSSDDVVVAYEADNIDPTTRTGWSVVLTGRAHTITEPDQVSRYEQLLHPINHADTVVAIEPVTITGFRVIAAEA